MRILWTSKALSDLARSHEFLLSRNPKAAESFIDAFCQAVERLPDYPGIGETVEKHFPREVRRLFVKHYEITYEVKSDSVEILRIRHMREHR